MAKKTNSLDKWMEEIREVATESRSPGANLSALNCFLSASSKNLSYLKFAEQLKAKPAKKTKKKR